MFALAEDGYTSLFEQLVACIISVRRRDEVSLPAARRLFAQARTPHAMARMDQAGIDACMRDVTFHEAKASQIHELARRVSVEHGDGSPAIGR